MYSFSNDIIDTNYFKRYSTSKPSYKASTPSTRWAIKYRYGLTSGPVFLNIFMEDDGCLI